MKELLFNTPFMLDILDGNKRSTIRRDTTLVVGDVVALVGMLMCGGDVCERPFKEALIDAIFPISIDCEAKRVWVSEEALKEEEVQSFMREHGWHSVEEGFSFYEGMYGTRFDAVSISWL